MKRLLIVTGPKIVNEMKNDLLARNWFMEKHTVIADEEMEGGVISVPFDSVHAKNVLKSINGRQSGRQEN